MKKACFAGSFDPFTNGHLDVVKKCSELFDIVYIMIGVNVRKSRHIPADAMKTAIEGTLKRLNLENCVVCIHDGLLVDFLKNNDIKYMARGLRSALDFEYEENMARVNKLLYEDIEYIYIRADTDVFSALSSSMVRELKNFGKDISEYVPKETLEVYKEIQ